uniref:Ribonuclease VapC n=1 Tax=Candidatus Kentrum sp. FW TaxID=2126338 RepID=A0A450SL62_9GAMM|nr:MAG: Predicted nucleic acid-binding protein, contains PIN domain [Candidatus Kentron sp. FW]
MMVLIDTCGWIEWFTAGAQADLYEPYFQTIEAVIVPTSVQFELYKWVRREATEARALESIALTGQGNVVPLNTNIALLAADLALEHRLSFADAIIYATAHHHRAVLVTSDEHFEGLSGVEYYPKRY